MCALLTNTSMKLSVSSFSKTYRTRERSSSDPWIMMISLSAAHLSFSYIENPNSNLPPRFPPDAVFINNAFPVKNFVISSETYFVFSPMITSSNLMLPLVKKGISLLSMKNFLTLDHVKPVLNVRSKSPIVSPS
ncbi:hypothetical protein AR158_c012R [Paramecium bursaria Chlorella virus AR158]|uniref:hypothetical protein n=1 Tax=Paramecium bursaria Chlorella virus AR158 TaxID=380598 RepID=UPI00015AA70F|nr:hypothetical protein AR158_c012R [Paramecium bursaria Chlorella virus AR158]ABU43558.1 hypothetical protein AR158_c012R [Paramecium bursaria Chlorella virus AR158]